MEYPLPNSETPIKTRIFLHEITNIVQGGVELLFPHIISGTSAFVVGCSKENWIDLYECMNIYCSCHGITKMFFMWDTTYFSYDVVDWKMICPPVRQDFHNYLMSTYNIGWTVNFNETPHKTIESYAVVDCSIQMFVSPGYGDVPSSRSSKIPSINAHNPSIVGSIAYKKLRCYCHSNLALNISNVTNGSYNTAKYIGDLLSYCSAHGFLGVVFHCGKSVKKTREEAIQIMRDNIINGIRSKIGLSAKFLLETPAGQGTELFHDAGEFFTFVRELLAIPDIASNIGVCVDTCHVFASSYDPYNYLKEACNQVPVNLVHFNDSKNDWNSRVDRHAPAGTGMIPYPLLEKTAAFAKNHNIDMVIEY
jgi:endonuclease IV